MKLSELRTITEVVDGMNEADPKFAACSDAQEAARTAFCRSTAVALLADLTVEDLEFELRDLAKRLGLPAGTRIPPPAAQAGVSPRRRRRMTPKLLEEVAGIYRSAHEEGRPPTMAVAEYFRTPHRTAARWVGAARDAGKLGPAIGPMAGEVAADG